MDLKIIIAVVIGLISIGAAVAAAVSDSKVVATTVESIARQPEAEAGLFKAMLIGIGLVESIPIIAIVIAFMLIGKLG
jgi:F-type H+-transporting ATPase subunit c